VSKLESEVYSFSRIPPGKEKLLPPLLAAKKFSLFVHIVTTPTRLQEHHVTSKLVAFCYSHISKLPRKLQDHCFVHTTLHVRIASTTCVQRRASRLLIVRIAPDLLRLCRASGRVVSPLDFSSVDDTGSHRASGHCVSRRDYSLSGLHRLYCAYAVHPNAPSRRSTSRQSVALALAVCPVIPLCIVTACLAAATDILRLRCASGCLGTSRGSSSTTSTTPHVRVPRHLARLVAWLVAPLVVDYFAYAAHPGASAPRAARCRLLRLARLIVDYFASRRLVVDYFAYAAHPGALARREARHVARRRLLHVARLVVDYFAYATRLGASAPRATRRAARRRLLHLCRVSGCLGMSHGSLRGSSSTTLCAATSSCDHTCSNLATPCVVTTCLAATLDLLRVRRVPPRRRLPVASCRPFISTSFPN
jgi:hypothetical protein